MASKWESIFFAGMLILAFIVVVLSYHPTTDPRVAFINIDTQLSGESEEVNVAKLKISLNEQQHLNNFPYRIGAYQGTDSSNSETIKGWLKAGTLLIRTYRNEVKWAQPIFLVLVHSAKGSSLHAPPICYRAQGYSTVEESIDSIYMEDTAIIKRIEEEEEKESNIGDLREWVAEKLGISTEPVEIPVNRLIVEKSENDSIADRRLAFYVYLKDMEFIRHEYCLVRVSGIIPIDNDYSDFEEELKVFMSQTLTRIFEDVSEKNERLISVIAGIGIQGYLILILLFGIPLAMIIYPLAARKVFSPVKTGEPVPGEMTSEVIPDKRPFISPYDVADKSGNEKILASYYNSRRIIEEVTGLDVESYPTIRDFLNAVISSLPVASADRFARLTGIAEAAMYSAPDQDEGIVEEACRLFEEILEEFKESI